MDILSSLRRNPEIVVAIFTVVIALATAAYAVLTFLLVRETKRLRESQVEPLVGVFLRTSEPWSISFDVIIRNYGPGPARDFRWRIDADLEDLRTHNALIGPILAFEGISYLAPSQEIRFPFGTAPSLLGGEVGPPAKPIRVRTSYKTEKGEERKGDFTLDVTPFRGTVLAQKPAEEKIAEALENVARSLKSKTV